MRKEEGEIWCSIKLGGALVGIVNDTVENFKTSNIKVYYGQAEITPIMDFKEYFSELKNLEYGLIEKNGSVKGLFGQNSQAGKYKANIHPTKKLEVYKLGDENFIPSL